jgi:hypothetical protein
MRSYSSQNFKMETLNYHFILFALTFAFGLCNASLVTIFIRNNLQSNVKITCYSGGSGIYYRHPHTLLQIKYPARQSYNCFADWHNRVCLFSAYDHQFDQGHPYVYWNVEKDGLYHSWNNKNFVKKVGWK